jgi:hypothetical protein
MRKMARNKETQLTLSVPDDFSSSERRELAEKVMEFIIDRTKSGYNVYGRDWSGKAGEYTEAYAKRKGVSTGGPVDLALDHDMLDSMQYFASLSGPGEITIGYRKGSKIERKAEGNILGTYGQPEPIPGKARPFLDILAKDYRDLIDEVRDERE